MLTYSMYTGMRIRSNQLFVFAETRRWDFSCSVDEVMRHLHALVMARQVLYLGVSDTPAWVVVKANECEESSLGSCHDNLT